MPEVIEIGGLALNGMLLTALIAVFVGYGALRLWTARSRGTRSGPWGDLTAGAAAIGAAVWKFGVLFREPSLLWEQPRLLLVIVGSGEEAYAGLAAAGLVWIWLARRRGVGLLRALDALAVSAAGGLLAWNLLSAIEYRWGYAAVCAALLALLIGRAGPDAAHGAEAGPGDKARDAAGAAERAEPAGIEAGDAKASEVGAGSEPDGVDARKEGACNEADGADAGEGGADHEAGSAAATGSTRIAAGSTAGVGGAKAQATANGTAAADDPAAACAAETASGMPAGEDAGSLSGTGRISSDGEAAVLAGYVLGAGCLAVSLFAVPAPWVRPPELAGLTSTQLLFIAAGLAAAALDAYIGRGGRMRNGPGRPG